MSQDVKSEVTVEAIGTHIKVRSIEASRSFYEAIGFVPVFAYGDPDFLATIPSGIGTAPERYRGITYAASKGGTLEIAEGHIAVPDSRVYKEEVTSPKVSAMVTVSSLAPLLKSGALRPKFPVRRYYWGTIEVAVRDPDGFVVVFVARDSAEELAAVKELVTVEEIAPA
jgi:catechol 2,3-dioxygenase-like lactoylglutathione lyase family enzyme